MSTSDGADELQSTSEQVLIDLAPNSSTSTMVTADVSVQHKESELPGTAQEQKEAHSAQSSSNATKHGPEPELPAITNTPDKMEEQGRDSKVDSGATVDQRASQAEVEASDKPSVPDPSVLAPPKDDTNEKKSSTQHDHKFQDTHSPSVNQEETAPKEKLRSPSPPPPPPKDDKFLGQPKEAVDPPRQPCSTIEYDEKQGLDEKQPFDEELVTNVQKDTGDDDTRSEIQSIMDQFGDQDTTSELENIITPRLEPPHPPRTSSLDPAQAPMPSPILHRTQSRDSYTFSPSAVRPGSISGVSISGLPHLPESTSSPRPQSTMFQPPPPSPDPEPELPFDFHRFLEQLRHRTADPVARFLRSFLLEFGKKQWMVHEQVKIISDFLEFIAKKMALCEVWRSVSDVEFDNAREGMEKLVMNRLYNQTFSPAIPPVEVASPSKGRRARNLATTSNTPGRKGQHQEDVERDAVIAQKIRIYGWIREDHLDIPPVNDKGRKFLVLAQQELLKINSYRAPRDKVICVLNCCKVIFGFLKNSKGDQSADSFIPLLIYTVLRANPEHLVSNVQYILRFRNQEKLGGEAGYYISSLMGVVTFVEGLDRTNLTVTDEEFERNVEASVSAIAEGHKADEYEATTHQKRNATLEPSSPTKSAYQPHYSEKGAPSRPELTPRNSTEGERAGPRRGNSTRQKNSAVTGSDEVDEKDAVAGLLRTIQKPLSTIGRLFSDESPPSSSQAQVQAQAQPHPALTPQPGSTPRLSPGLPTRPLQRKSSEESRHRRSQDPQQRARSVGPPTPSDPHAEEDAAARQARAEAAEAQRIQAQEHKVVVETLQGMFPDLDREVISDVVRLKEGRVGLAVDACLALST